MTLSLYLWFCIHFAELLLCLLFPKFRTCLTFQMIVNASYVDYERAWIFIFEFCNYKKSDAYNLLTNDVTGLSISFQNNFVFPSEVTFTISQLTWCRLSDFYLSEIWCCGYIERPCQIRSQLFILNLITTECGISRILFCLASYTYHESILDR